MHPSYTFPDISGHTILYKGRRYIALAVSKKQPLDIYGDDEDFVVWDGLYDAAVSVGKIRPDGVIEGELAFSHVNIEVEDAKSMRDFVTNTKKSQETYFKECGV